MSQIHSAARAVTYLERHTRELLGAAAFVSLIASIISMALIYGDPLAHIRICLGGQPPVASGYDGILLYGHCGWCYMTAALGVAALIMPGRKS